MQKRFLNFWTSFRMQLKRRFIMLLKKEDVAKGISRRKGECKSCGECCKASFDCPFLYQEGDKFLCRIHETKPEVCKTYPFSEEDIFPSTKGKCGYYFEPEK